jgi:hypothetical protein
MKTKIRNLMGAALAAAMLMSAVPSDSRADIASDTWGILLSQGAVTLPYGIAFPVDCLGSSFFLCANYANSAVTYVGFILPCRLPGGCNAITPTPPLPPLPLPGPVGSGYQLGADEAIVIYGKVPPVTSYWGIESSFHERDEANFPNPGDRDPLRPGEIPPPPATPDRVVVSSSVGDTENMFNLPSAPNPEGPGEVFAKIVSGNQNVAHLVRNSLIAAGFPASAITIKGYPASYVFSTGNDADTYREILRMARPFDDAQMNAYLNPAARNLQAWRVTAPAQPFAGYPEVTFTERDTGTDQVSGECGIVSKWENHWRKEFRAELGSNPDINVRMEPRRYDDLHCIDTGTYCWGNNNDALYADARYTDDTLVEFDLSGPDSRLLITGIDQVADGVSQVWNWDIYDPATGLAKETLLFTDIQADDYTSDYDDFCAAKKGNCECKNGTLGDKLYWVQVRQTCEPSDRHCLELNPAAGIPPTRTIMHRVYLNPVTETGPSQDETRLPRLFHWE